MTNLDSVVELTVATFLSIYKTSEVLYVCEVLASYNDQMKKLVLALII